MAASYRNTLVWGGLAGALLAATPAHCEEPAGGPPDIQQLRREVEEQSQQLATQRRALEQQEKALAENRRLLREMQQRLEALQGRLGGTATAAAEAESQSPPARVGQAPDATRQGRPPEVAPIFEQPGVLTRRGKVVLEPSLQYSYASNSRVALVGYTIIPAITIGLIDIRRDSHDTLIGALTARFGVTNRLELEAKLPYVYRDDASLTRPLATGSTNDSVFNASGKHLGDVELAARYQFNQGGGDAAYYVGTLRLKTRTGRSPFEVGMDPVTGLESSLPTGSGFYGVQPGLTVIYPSDPAVFFGGANYLWNIKRDVGDPYGTIDPGDAFTFNFGMGLGLNEKASFSVGYEHSIIGKDKQNGTFPPTAMATQLGTLSFGYSYRLSNSTSINLSLGAGLTTDSPDVQLMLRMPTTF